MDETEIVVIKNKYLNIYVNCFMLKTEKHSVFIDSGLMGNQNLIDSYIKDKTPVIISTHGHFDHVGLHCYMQKKGATLMAHPNDRRFYKDFDWHWQYLFGQYKDDFKLPLARREVFKSGIGFPVNIDSEIEDRQIIRIDNLTFEVFHTPGHSNGSICLMEKGSKALFTGDTLMGNGFFNNMPQYNDVKSYISSTKRIMNLEPSIIYSAHNEPIEGAMLATLANQGMKQVYCIAEIVEEYVYKKRNDETITLGEIVSRICEKQNKNVGAGACVSVMAHLRDMQEKYPVLQDILQTHEA